MAGSKSGLFKYSPVLRAIRLFVMMKLLSDGREFTLEQFVQLFRVCERTVFRDIRDLKSIDIPIRSLDGKYHLDRRLWAVWGVNEFEQSLRR